MNAYFRYSRMTLIWCIAGFFGLFVILPHPVFAGKLDDFEQDATEEEDEKDEGWLSFEDEEEEDDDSFVEDILGGIFHILFSGTDDEEDERNTLQPRERGGQPSGEPVELPSRHPLLPVFMVDGAYQNVDSDVGALDTRIELGISVFAAQGRFTWYFEDAPSDELGMHQLHGLFRLPFGERLKVGVGVGALILDGNNQNSGFSMTTPLLFSVNKTVGLEFRPTWSWVNENRLDDYDVSLSLNDGFTALRVGYRSVQSEHESLNGPYAGFSVKF